MNLRTILLWGAIFAAGLLFGYMVQETVKKDIKAPEAVHVEPALDDKAEIKAQDIELVQGKQGILQWKLRAEGADYDMDKRTVDVVKPRLSAYFGDDRKEVFLRADSGMIDQKNDNLNLRDNVDGKFGSFALSAGQFDYVGAIGKVLLKGGVAVSRPDISVNATAVEIDITGRILTAAGGVVAIITPAAIEEAGKEDFAGKKEKQ